MRLGPLALCLAVALVPACGRFGRAADADGGTDASDDGGGGCAAKLCVDFDDPAVRTPWGFDEVHAMTADSVGIVPGLSPPNALSITGTDPAPTYLGHSVPSTATTVRIRAAVRIDEVVSATIAWLLYLHCAAASDNYEIKLQYGHIVLKGETPGTSSVIANSPAPGSWTSMELAATLTSTSTHLTAKVGDNSAVLDGAACTPESLRIGSSGIDTGSVRISVDDIVLDWN